jgi:hypothetical protein
VETLGSEYYFGDISIHRGILDPCNRYRLNVKALDVLSFKYTGLRYTDNRCIKVLWI